MTFPSFTSRVTDPAERGLEFGLRWRDAIRANVDGYAVLFAASGATTDQVRAWSEEAFAQAAAWAPALADEMAGIAAGAAVPPWQVAALNARTEILAALRSTGEGECSTVVVLPPDGPARTMQTWDWHDHLRDAPVLWAFSLRSGRVVRTFTEYGVLAKIGVNDAGLGVHFNILRHASDHASIGVPVHLVARRILAEATTVDEAVDIARSAKVSASTVITAVTAGAAAALEICPDGVGVVRPSADGVLLRANHFLDPSLVAGERLGVVRPLTYARQSCLADRVALLRSADRTERARAMLSHAPDGAPVCAHANPAEPFDQRWETLATISLDVTAARMHVHQAGPCQVTESTWQLF